MQYGLLKYDEWNDLFWLYNSLDSRVRTSLTGALVGIGRADESIKYTHFVAQDRNPYHTSHEYHPYCGCHQHGINALGVYEENLLVGKGRDLYVMSKDGHRTLNVLTPGAQYDVTAAGTRHIALALFPTTPGSFSLSLSANSDEVYFVDAFTGQIKSKLICSIDQPCLKSLNDKVCVLADFVGGQASSTCHLPYQVDVPNVEEPQPAEAATPKAEPAKKEQDQSPTDAPKKESSSFEKIAKKYGSIESIPEFVPSSFASTPGNTKSFGSTGNLTAFGSSNTRGFSSSHNLTFEAQASLGPGMPGSQYLERTVGSMTLECILSELKPSRLLRNEFVDTTCVGMASGLFHIVDNRTERLESTIKAHNSAVYSISASANTIATTSCRVYSYANAQQYQYNPYAYAGHTMLFEPVVCLHDIRMMRSASMVLSWPVSKVCIVPRSDRLLALAPGGRIFDCAISSMSSQWFPAGTSEGVVAYDLELALDATGQRLDVFSSDSIYSVHSAALENALSADLDFSPAKLPPNLREIAPSQSREANNTPFASMVRTFDGDVAHIFVQMFFFLPKLPSIQHHVCELSQCITCQIGFGLHNLQVHYRNSLRAMERDARACGSAVVKKYSNNLTYVTQLQELMLVEREPNLRTPLFLLLWMIQKVNNELHNYASKNNLGVTTSLMRDLFAFSKVTTTECARARHRNAVQTDDNYHVPYEHIEPHSARFFAPESQPDADPNSHRAVRAEYCTECFRNVECSVSVRYKSCPNLLIVDFTAAKVAAVPEFVTFNGARYVLLNLYFTLPPSGQHHRALAYVRLPQEYQVGARHAQVDTRSWVLLNDGVVIYVDEHEADILDFTKHWKIPVFAMYMREPDSSPKGAGFGGSRALDEVEEIAPAVNPAENIISVMGRLVPLPYPTPASPVPAHVFFSEDNIAHNPLAHNKVKSFTPLTLEELNSIQNSTFLLALDIECVKSNLAGPPARGAPEPLAASNFITPDQDDKYLYTLAR